MNGESVGRFSYADDAMRTLTVRVPSSVAGSLGDGRVVVRLAVPTEVTSTPGGADRRTLRLGSVRVEPADGAGS